MGEEPVVVEPAVVEPVVEPTIDYSQYLENMIQVQNDTLMKIQENNDSLMEILKVQKGQIDILNQSVYMGNEYLLFIAVSLSLVTALTMFGIGKMIARK